MDFYSFALTPWFWLALTAAFSLIELATSLNLVTVWFALASLVMVFVSGLTELLAAPIRFRLHFGIFLALSAALLAFTRPIAVRKFKAGAAKTNVDGLIGRNALVVKAIGNCGTGEVKIGGQVWTAVSETDEPLAKNTECVVARIEGVKAVVRAKRAAQ